MTRTQKIVLVGAGALAVYLVARAVGRGLGEAIAHSTPALSPGKTESIQGNTVVDQHGVPVSNPELTYFPPG